MERFELIHTETTELPDHQNKEYDTHGLKLDMYAHEQAKADGEIKPFSVTGTPYTVEEILDCKIPDFPSDPLEARVRISGNGVSKLNAKMVARLGQTPLFFMDQE